MSRPRPTVIHEFIDSKTGKTEQVIKAEGVFVVVYDNISINLKTFNAYHESMGAKYKKTAFSSKAHAVNLANRLNKLHNTDKFVVVNVIIDEYVIIKDSNE